MKNVRHVPKIKGNLISLGMLDDVGYLVNVNEGFLIIIRESRIVLEAPKCNGLYIVQNVHPLYHALLARCRKDEGLELWHRRLYHISANSLKELLKQGVVKSRGTKRLKFCEHCVYNKAKRLKFTKEEYSTKSILGCVHANLWEPSKTHSLSGYLRYLLSLIDDYSRKVWTYIHKSKDQTFERFIDWKVEIENQIEKMVKHLRTDNGLEFPGASFNQFCFENGITIQKITSYTPQQNGVTEWMNRTILEIVRCMLSEANKWLYILMITN